MSTDKPQYCYICDQRGTNVPATHVITFDNGAVCAYCDKHAELVTKVFNPWGMKTVTRITWPS